MTGNISRRELSRGPSSCGNNKWPLMTRAHLSQALVYVALKENVSSSVSQAPTSVLRSVANPALSLSFFLYPQPSVAMLALLSEGGALDAFWADIASRYLLHTCGEEDSAALKKTVSCPCPPPAAPRLSVLTMHGIAASVFCRARPASTISCSDRPSTAAPLWMLCTDLVCRWRASWECW